MPTQTGEEEFEEYWSDNDEPDGPYLTRDKLAKAAYLAAHAAQQVRIEVMRAALEKITNCEDYTSPVDAAIKIAREALRGE